MATASVTNTFAPATTILSAAVNQNFTDLVNFLNGQVLHRDGSKTMTADLDANGNKVKGLAAAVANGQAVRYEQLVTLTQSFQALELKRTNPMSPATSTNVITDVTWETELADPWSGYAAPGDAGFVLKANGLYLVVAQVAWAAGGSFERSLFLNGTDAVFGAGDVFQDRRAVIPSPAGNNRVTSTFVARTGGADQTFKIRALQNSGSDLQITDGALRVVSLVRGLMA